MSGAILSCLSCLSLSSWSNFGRPATPGKVHRSSKFSPFVDNGSDRGSLESQHLRNSFIHLSRLIHANYIVSHLFLNFFRSRHDALLFKHASLLLLLLLIGFMAYCNHDLSGAYRHLLYRSMQHGLAYSSMILLKKIKN